MTTPIASSPEDIKLAPKSSAHNPPERTVRTCLAQISKARLHPKDKSVRIWLADLICDRLHSRYVNPINATPNQYKHGFTVMAISCLLIETLECFWLGLPDSLNESGALKMKDAKGNLVAVNTGRVFSSFFRNRVANLIALAPTEAEFKNKDTFYKHVRCGILHQGGTTGRWTIARWKHWPILDKDNRRINATLFHKEIADAVANYCNHLRSIPFTHEDWENAIIKLEAICADCKSA